MALSAASVGTGVLIGIDCRDGIANFARKHLLASFLAHPWLHPTMASDHMKRYRSGKVPLVTLQYRHFVSIYAHAVLLHSGDLLYSSPVSSL